MGLMGSALARGLAGAASAVGDIANKYIDQDLALKRAQAMADIQRLSSVQTEKDIESFRQSDEVQSRRRNNERLSLEMKSDAELRGKRTEAMDPELQGAISRNAAARSGAEASGRGEAEANITKRFGNDPLFIAAQRRIAQAKHIESSDTVARAELARMEIKDRKTLTEKYDQLAAIELDDTLTPDQKAAKAKPLMVVIQAIKSKNNPGGKETGGAGEFDEVTTTEKTMDDKGGEKTVQTKSKRRPGGQPETLTDEAKVRAALEQARKDGKVSEAVADLRARGATPQQLKALGVTDQDMAATKSVPETVNDNTLSMGDDYRSPEFKSRLQARIVEAQRGGRPLTRIERVRATQLGLSE